MTIVSLSCVNPCLWLVLLDRQEINPMRCLLIIEICIDIYVYVLCLLPTAESTFERQFRIYKWCFLSWFCPWHMHSGRSTRRCCAGLKKEESMRVQGRALLPLCSWLCNYLWKIKFCFHDASPSLSREPKASPYFVFQERKSLFTFTSRQSPTHAPEKRGP